MKITLDLYAKRTNRKPVFVCEYETDRDTKGRIIADSIDKLFAYLGEEISIDLLGLGGVATVKIVKIGDEE